MREGDGDITQLLARFQNFPEEDRDAIYDNLSPAAQRQLDKLMTGSLHAGDSEVQSAAEVSPHSVWLAQRVATPDKVKLAGLLPDTAMTQAAHKALLQIMDGERHKPGLPRQSGQTLAGRILAYFSHGAKSA